MFATLQESCEALARLRSSGVEQRWDTAESTLGVFIPELQFRAKALWGRSNDSFMDSGQL